MITSSASKFSGNESSNIPSRYFHSMICPEVDGVELLVLFGGAGDYIQHLTADVPILLWSPQATIVQEQSSDSDILGLVVGRKKHLFPNKLLEEEQRSTKCDNIYKLKWSEVGCSVIVNPVESCFYHSGRPATTLSDDLARLITENKHLSFMAILYILFGIYIVYNL